ncbi:hypothetical protein [Paludisphaera mucosa]|uniref:Secreted protein n=1 Tax=Paludisphaera mucosa TaxID=3030827 RepID=A0ABT6FC88_9BACT|nr:hypothetical protein [Paludisphaera mucosa]MDG3005111.1 hypothetical protein [Paludisphaera mucosa]
MRSRIHATLFLLAAVVPAACDDAGTHPPVAADELPPLAAEDVKKIQAEDARIEAEERGTPVLPGKKKKAPGATKPAPTQD